MEAPNITIRRATYGDLPEVARIHVLSWQQAYAGLIPQSFLDDLKVSDRLAKWIENFEGNTTEDNNLYLAFENGEAVGFISFGRGRDEGRTDEGEIYAAYLLKATWGKSIGYQLFQVAREKLKGQGFTSAYLWVVANNTNAIAAYQKWGGVIDPLEAKSITIHGQKIQEIAITFLSL